MVKIKMRKGVAMIELIFSIVIMAYVFTALPQLMTQVNHASTLGIKQEAISLLASQMNLVMSNEWDDKNTRSNYSSFILEVDKGDEDLKHNLVTKLRGNRTEYKNTRLFSEIETITASENLIIEYDKDTTHFIDDVDDYNEREVSLTLGGEENDRDYIDQQIKINTDVYYVSYNGDFSNKEINVTNSGLTLGTTNIKEIVGTLTTDNKKFKNNKLVLKAFSSNLGAYSPEVVGGF